MMGRYPCCSMEGFHSGAWTKQEDIILSDYIRIHGDDGGWTNLPLKAGLKRSGKSCRLRWLNYLRPYIKRGNISPDEEELIIRLHRLLGNRWSLIAGRLPGRTDNEIKNYWNTHMSKKLRLSMKQSQAKNLKTTSKSCSPLPNHVLKTSAVRITMDSTVTRPIGFKGYESSNNDSNSDEAFKSCNVKETTTEPIAFAMSGVHVVEGEGRNPTCSISSLADEESRPHSDDFAGDTATLEYDTLFDLNELSLSQWNPLFSPWDWSIDPHGLEEFYRVATAEMNEFEDIMG